MSKWRVHSAEWLDEEWRWEDMGWCTSLSFLSQASLAGTEKKCCRSPVWIYASGSKTRHWRPSLKWASATGFRLWTWPMESLQSSSEVPMYSEDGEDQWWMTSVCASYLDKVKALDDCFLGTASLVCIGPVLGPCLGSCQGNLQALGKANQYGFIRYTVGHLAFLPMLIQIVVSSNQNHCSSPVRG